MENLTSNEALAAGAILGTMFGFVLVCVIIWYLLLVIASWKIFTKAGEKGWKSLIPIYNVYILYKISGLSFWKWLVLPAVIIGIVNTIGQNISDYKTLFDLVAGIIEIVMTV